MGVVFSRAVLALCPSFFVGVSAPLPCDGLSKPRYRDAIP